jgi:hypothetical protein
MFPPVPEKVIEAGYQDFADRWNPILDVFDECGVRFAHEVHPSEIAYDYWTTVRNTVLGSHLPWGDPRRGWDFVSAGREDVPWESSFRALTAIGYTGPSSIEWEDASSLAELAAVTFPLASPPDSDPLAVWAAWRPGPGPGTCLWPGPMLQVIGTCALLLCRMGTVVINWNDRGGPSCQPQLLPARRVGPWPGPQRRLHPPYLANAL